MPVMNSSHAPARLIDLSHPLVSEMAVAPGLPAPRIVPVLTREASRSAYNGTSK